MYAYNFHCLALFLLFLKIGKPPNEKVFKNFQNGIHTIFTSIEAYFCLRSKFGVRPDSSNKIKKIINYIYIFLVSAHALKISIKRAFSRLFSVSCVQLHGRKPSDQIDRNCTLDIMSSKNSKSSKILNIS